MLTAGEAGLLGAADEEYLTRSGAEGRVVITCDRDFLRLHHQQPHAGIAYCEQGTRTVGQIVARLVPIHQVLEPAEMAERVEFL